MNYIKIKNIISIKGKKVKLEKKNINCFNTIFTVKYVKRFNLNFFFKNKRFGKE